MYSLNKTSPALIEMILPYEVRVGEFLLDINTSGNICIRQGVLKSGS